MNYTINGITYIADEGYVFKSKRTGMISKSLSLCPADSIDNYEVIPEPVPEEMQNEEVAEDVSNTDV